MECPNVEPAELVGHFADDRGRRGRIGLVRPDRARPHPRCAQLPGHGLRGLPGAQEGDGDVGPGASQGAGNRCPDAPRPPGNKGDLPGQIMVQGNLLSVTASTVAREKWNVNSILEG
jgi:hypothetical protein